MKNIYLFFLSIILLSITAKAQYVTISNAALREELKLRFPLCFNASDKMDTTCSDIVSAEQLSIYSVDLANFNELRYFKSVASFAITGSNIPGNLAELPASITSLTLSGDVIPDLTTLPHSLTRLEIINGSVINNFTATFPNTLTYLDLSQNYFNQVPALPNSLTYLDVSFNNITSLPSLPGSLNYLYCYSNPITSLPPLPGSLIELDCIRCKLNFPTGIPTLPNSLKVLNLGYNKLTGLPALPAALEYLYCDSNLLISLPTLPASLTNLYCGNNKLTSLPYLPSKLFLINCTNNQLSSLPALPASLMVLECSSNQLMGLPALPNSLNRMSCSHNNLAGLPELPASLQNFDISNNNIYCLPKLPGLPLPLEDPLGSVGIQMDDKIKCVPNRAGYNIVTYDSLGSATRYDLGDGPPLCTPVNNIYHCKAFPVINGSIFYDNNSNGVKDNNELYKTNTAVKLSDGQYAFTNSNGYFEFSADTGNFTITIPVLPHYYTAMPSIFTYSFINFDTLVTATIALKPNVMSDSLEIRVTPTWAARPGFPFSYYISYENIGTTTLSPNIFFDYDNNLLAYDSSSNGLVINTGNSLSLTESNLMPGQRKSFIAYFTIKTTAHIGDAIRTKGSIITNTASSTDSSVIEIRGSFDPNDKQATPKLTPEQVISGKYINYTIHFQNTGNDTAFNIVITDTLNNMLQPGTLQIIDASNTCKVTVNGNIIFFEFLDVLLPDSNRNEQRSHGFVSFRIKPQLSAVVNSNIPNKAAIYFDYNSPVITNTATTLIKESGIVPLKLLAFNAFAQADNKVSLYWSTANEINTRSFDIEQSIDGRNFSKISSMNAKGETRNSYMQTVLKPVVPVIYYRLKIKDTDARYSYSTIIRINSKKQASGITILNNPVTGKINTRIIDPALKNTTARIINGQGAVVKSFLLLETDQTVDVSVLPAGSYYLQTQLTTEKFIIGK